MDFYYYINYFNLGNLLNVFIRYRYFTVFVLLISSFSSLPAYFFSFIFPMNLELFFFVNTYRCPIFKVLTYYGSAKARKLLRTGWSKLNSFHICITSYQLVVQDANSFRRKRWYYMALDEAHNIKVRIKNTIEKENCRKNIFCFLNLFFFYLTIHASIRLPTAYLSIHLCTYLSISLSIYVSIYVSIYLSIYQSTSLMLICRLLVTLHALQYKV